MSHFGPRVIGKETFQREVAIDRSGGRHFGSRVIGKVFKAPTDAEAPEVDKTTEAPITANITELETALDNNPAFYESLYAAELGRPDGPRRGALKLFLMQEMEREGGPRSERVEEIEKALTPKKKKKKG